MPRTAVGRGETGVSGGGWPADRAVRQDPAAGDRPPGRRGGRGDRAVRRTRALARARAHLPDHPAGAVERARRRARRRAGRGRAGALVPLPGAAGAAGRRGGHHGPLRPAAAGNPPGARAGAAWPRTGPCWRRSCGTRRSPRCSAPGSTPTRSIVHPSQRGHLKQALLKVGWPAEDEAGYVDGEAHPIELDQANWHLRAYQEEAVDGVLGRRLRRGRAALRRRQDAGRRGRDGAGRGDHADPGDEHRRRAAVAARAAGPHVADRGGDRRVLRRAQGDPPGHHRHLPGDDPQAGRASTAPGPVRLPRLGSGHLRRGAPAARAGVPDDRRPAVPPPARA